MFGSRTATIGFLLITLLLGTGCTALEVSAVEVRVEARVETTSPASLAASSSGVQVFLSAADSTTSWDDRIVEAPHFDLPLLYLHHEREEAAQGDCTLALQLSGLAGGTEVQIEAVSRHLNIATGARHRETTRVALPDRRCTADEPCTIHWTFDPQTMLSDLYDLRVRDGAGNLLWESAGADRPDFVALDTWDAGVDEHTVRITYATLFPFARGQNDLDNRLPPGAVTDFIEQRFLPLILDTWHTQFHAWGFGPIHAHWDADGVVEIFVTTPPFALFGGTGTYTGFVYDNGEPYPERRLWWLSNNNSFQPYDSLESAYRAVYAHEFFHLVQWNVLRFTGCPMRGWKNVFIEAQAKFAASVQFPELEMHRNHVAVGFESEYGSAAQRFLAHGLNTSYRTFEAQEVDMYDAALYWRFLYEQFGHMGIIRAAIEEMGCRYQPDIVTSMAEVLDAALARFDGPFRTFEESLVAFARANYGLRLENGRCVAADGDGCRGKYHDPDGLYPEPPLEAELDYRGGTLVYDGSVATSFGMDFVEVNLEGGPFNQPLQVILQSGGARLNAQVWMLGGGAESHGGEVPAGVGSGGTRLRALMPQPEEMSQGDEGLYTFTLSRLDPAKYHRLAVIITRLDPGEGKGTTGDYTITLDASPRP